MRKLIRPLLLLSAQGVALVGAFAAASAGLSSPALAQAAAPIARTVAGQLRGAVQDGVLVFKGVRYGESTAGARFQPARPAAPWRGVRDAFDFGQQSPQADPSQVSLFKSWSNNRPMSEDTLFLNVWTPALDGKRRPVMVWFHGGGFSSGSGASHAYDGVRLARKGDVVVVTVNHRLNAFGYLYLSGLSDDPALAHSGNVGNLDMLLSLRWVRDNIARFGGDPSNVMIFGESGGGAKVSTLMAMPEANGLFHKAAVQSGSALTVSTPAAATASARKLLAALGLDETQVDQLRTMPMDRLRQAAAKAGVDFRPVVDGRSLPRHPFDPDAPPVSAKVPMLIGTTKDENTLLIGNRDPSSFAITEAELPTRLAPFLDGLDPAQVIAAYRRLYPRESPSELFFSITTARTHRTRAWAQAERKAALRAAPAYLYQLDWETPVDDGKWGAPHALEIGFVFDNVAKSASMSGVGAEQQRLADTMSDAWLRFARTGNPGWPAYEPNRRMTMVFDASSRVEADWGGAERIIFASVPPLGR